MTVQCNSNIFSPLFQFNRRYLHQCSLKCSHGICICTKSVMVVCFILTFIHIHHVCIYIINDASILKCQITSFYRSAYTNDMCDSDSYSKMSANNFCGYSVRLHSSLEKANFQVMHTIHWIIFLIVSSLSFVVASI